MQLLLDEHISPTLVERWAEIGVYAQSVQHTGLSSTVEEFKKEEMGYVFPADSKSGHLVSPKKGWRRILQRAAIQDLRLHDLRRTLGGWQAATGASLAVIGKSLGHKDVSTTAIYARLNIEPVRDAMQTATTAMLAASGLLPKADVMPIKKAANSKT